MDRITPMIAPAKIIIVKIPAACLNPANVNTSAIGPANHTENTKSTLVQIVMKRFNQAMRTLSGIQW